MRRRGRWAEEKARTGEAEEAAGGTAVGGVFAEEGPAPGEGYPVSGSVRLAASLSRLLKKAILASDGRLERAVSGDVQKGGPREQVEGFRRSWRECGEMRVTCVSRIELTDGKRDDEELLKVGGNGMVWKGPVTLYRTCWMELRAPLGMNYSGVIIEFKNNMGSL